MYLRGEFMYPMKEFIRNHKIEIENGAHFVPRQTHRRPLWMYYPNKRFPFWTFEVEEDIFPECMKVPKDITIEARGIRFDTGEIVEGDLVKRPMLCFAVTNYPYELRQEFIPLYYFCTEIFNKQGKFIVLRDEIEIIREFSVYDRSIW